MKWVARFSLNQMCGDLSEDTPEQNATLGDDWKGKNVIEQRFDTQDQAEEFLDKIKSLIYKVEASCGGHDFVEAEGCEKDN